MVMLPLWSPMLFVLVFPATAALQVPRNDSGNSGRQQGRGILTQVPRNDSGNSSRDQGRGILTQVPRNNPGNSSREQGRGIFTQAIPPAPGGSAVDRHGFLRVEGNKVVGTRSGQPVRLRGMSLFWSQWRPQFWNAETVHWLMTDWNVTLVRAAMAVEHGGYLANPETEKARLRAVVDAAIMAGIYVIIDWHDHSAERHVKASSAFFNEMATAYGKYPNVLFEVFNEPVRQEWSTTIKPYHEKLVSTIRRSSENLVILGTRWWSQAVDEASRDPVVSTNLAYAIHFYAGTHRLSLREKVEQALANGVAVFATEWGTCDASGNGALDFVETQAWLDFLEKHGISDANWAIGDKEESCAALRPGASGSGGWRLCELTASGAFVRAGLRLEHATGAAPESCRDGGKHPRLHCSKAGQDCSSTLCCSSVGQQCFRKNQYWAGCRTSCTPGIDPSDPPRYQTPWTCEMLP